MPQIRRASAQERNWTPDAMHVEDSFAPLAGEQWTVETQGLFKASLARSQWSVRFHPRTYNSCTKLQMAACSITEIRPIGRSSRRGSIPYLLEDLKHKPVPDDLRRSWITALARVRLIVSEERCISGVGKLHLLEFWEDLLEYPLLSGVFPLILTAFGADEVCLLSNSYSPHPNHSRITRFKPGAFDGLQEWWLRIVRSGVKIIVWKLSLGVGWTPTGNGCAGRDSQSR